MLIKLDFPEGSGMIQIFETTTKYKNLAIGGDLFNGFLYSHLSFVEMKQQSRELFWVRSCKSKENTWAKMYILEH